MAPQIGTAAEDKRETMLGSIKSQLNDLHAQARRANMNMDAFFGRLIPQPPKGDGRNEPKAVPVGEIAEIGTMLTAVRQELETINIKVHELEKIA